MAQDISKGQKKRAKESEMLISCLSAASMILAALDSYSSKQRSDAVSVPGPEVCREAQCICPHGRAAMAWLRDAPVSFDSVQTVHTEASTPKTSARPQTRDQPQTSPTLAIAFRKVPPPPALSTPARPATVPCHASRTLSR